MFAIDIHWTHWAFSFPDRGLSLSSTGDRMQFDASHILGFPANVIAEQLTKIETVSPTQASASCLFTHLVKYSLVVFWCHIYAQSLWLLLSAMLRLLVFLLI